MLDVSGINYFMPLLGFLLVLVTLFAILLKIKIIGENKTILFLISFIVAIIFITFSGVREYLTALIPWFSVLLICAFFLFILIGFLTEDWEKFTKPITWVIIGLFSLIIITVAFYVFPEFYHMLPKTSNCYLVSPLRALKKWMYSRRIINTIILIISTTIVGLIITKSS